MTVMKEMSAGRLLRVVSAAVLFAFAVACGDQPLLERFPAAADQVVVPGAVLSTIDCDVDNFVFGGLGGPEIQEWYDSAVLAADTAIARFSIRAPSSFGITGSATSTKLVTYFDESDRPVADVRVERAAAGWYASGLQGCTGA